MREDGVSFRRADGSDLPAIRKMIAELEADDGSSYLPHIIDEWVASEPGGVYLAIDDKGVLGLTATEFTAPGEAWFQGMRVLKRARRKKIGFHLTRLQVCDAARQGGRVVRLATSWDNYPAQGLVETLGFSKSRQWIVASYDLTGTSGGRSPVVANGVVKSEVMGFLYERKYALACSWPHPWSIRSYPSALRNLIADDDENQWLLCWYGDDEIDMVCHLGVSDGLRDRFLLIDVVASAARASDTADMAAGMLCTARDIALSTDCQRIMVSVMQRTFAPIRRAARRLNITPDSDEWKLYIYQKKASENV